MTRSGGYRAAQPAARSAPYQAASAAGRRHAHAEHHRPLVQLPSRAEGTASPPPPLGRIKKSSRSRGRSPSAGARPSHGARTHAPEAGAPRRRRRSISSPRAGPAAWACPSPARPRLPARRCRPPASSPPPALQHRARRSRRALARRGSPWRSEPRSCQPSSPSEKTGRRLDWGRRLETIDGPGEAKNRRFSRKTPPKMWANEDVLAVKHESVEYI